MKSIRIFVLAVFSILAFNAITLAGDPPPGNDGGNCHGANQASCRPDPQPSHGQDCDEHGNNPDGNDDHCASSAPSDEPSTQPSTEPSITPSTAPSVAPSTAPSDEPIPGITPPPTDTE